MAMAHPEQYAAAQADRAATERRANGLEVPGIALT